MKFTQDLKKGIVYWLKDFSMPFVFTGMIFESLESDQQIPAHTEIEFTTNINLANWEHDIYNPERFGVKNGFKTLSRLPPATSRHV